MEKMVYINATNELMVHRSASTRNRKRCCYRCRRRTINWCQCGRKGQPSNGTITNLDGKFTFKGNQ